MPANRQNKTATHPLSAEQTKRSQLSATINALLSLRKKIRFGKLDWKTLRDEGRR
ncbi:MAG: hypothetical protein OXU34_07015 [Gammaproteobacteria bacterium]|nr:hypothetical protein [Gammaproteobacteria bacterium]